MSYMTVSGGLMSSEFQHRVERFLHDIYYNGGLGNHLFRMCNRNRVTVVIIRETKINVSVLFIYSTEIPRKWIHLNMYRP